MRLILSCLLITCLAVMGVKQEDFKLCSQSSFCRRLRSIATKQAEAPDGSFRSPYSVGKAAETEGTSGGSWTWPLKSSLYPDIDFELRVDVLVSDIVRIRADEVGSATPFKRYNETATWALVNDSPDISTTAKITHSPEKCLITYGPNAELALEVQHEPFRITHLRDGKPQVVLNDRSLFHMEHFRIKDVEAAEELLSEGEQLVLGQDRSWFETSDADMFEEKWKQWTDSKPKGEHSFRDLMTD